MTTATTRAGMERMAGIAREAECERTKRFERANLRRDLIIWKLKPDDLLALLRLIGGEDDSQTGHDPILMR
jgi:hypothetical protein